MTASIYDVENRLTLTRVRIDTLGTLGDGTGPPPLPYNAKESYRYDALGRRIWQRSHKDASCPNVEPMSGCKSHVTRTIWDGDNILYEIRTRGEEGASASVLEDDSPVGFGAHYGVVGYTHGGAIDQPLGLFKGSTQVMPLANYRGLFDRGLCPATLCSDAEIYFPGKASGVYGWLSRASGPPSWYGSLIEGQEDASGLQYKQADSIATSTLSETPPGGTT